MKKEFKLVSASVIGLVCTSLMAPSFAVTAVRSLGGTGTYTGASSASQATSTSKSAVTAARAGSVRVGSGTRTTAGTALRTPSTRSATAPRLSIGKYLSGSTAMKNDGKVNVDLSTNETVTNIQGNIDVLKEDIDNVKQEFKQELEQYVNIEGLQTELQSYAKDFQVDYENGVLTITRDGEAPQEISLFDIEEADRKINEMIAVAVKDLDIPDSVTYSAGDGVTIGEDNKISANIVAGDLIDIRKDEKTGQMLVSADIGAGDMIEIKGNTVSANVIVGALTGKLETDKLVTANQTVDYVTGYAIPKPGAGQCNTESSTCVLSVNNNGELYWLELVDKETGGDPNTVFEEITEEPVIEQDSNEADDI